jgi:hypothetical protein
MSSASMRAIMGGPTTAEDAWASLGWATSLAASPYNQQGALPCIAPILPRSCAFTMISVVLVGAVIAGPGERAWPMIRRGRSLDQRATMR